MENENINQELLIRFLCKQTNVLEEKEVKEWLEADTERYQLLEKLMRSKALVSQRMNSDWAKGHLEEIHKRISRKKSHRFFLKVAASFIGVILGTSLILMLLKENEEWQTITVAKADKYEVVLPDGTKVWLAPDTKFYYPLSFSSSSREVKLEGQGYFDVAHDKDRPFIVHTKYSDVEVLGTKFNVKAYANETRTTTVLVEGKVNIGFKNAQHKRIGEQLLYPAQKSKYNHRSQKYNVHKVDLRHELAWREKRLSFRQETFREIANKIERHYNVDVVFAEGDLSRKRLTGEFRNESIEEVLDTFQEWTSFTYSINNKTVTINH